jgi:hypothetical protein
MCIYSSFICTCSWLWAGCGRLVSKVENERTDLALPLKPMNRARSLALQKSTAEHHFLFDTGFACIFQLSHAYGCGERVCAQKYIISRMHTFITCRLIETKTSNMNSAPCKEIHISRWHRSYWLWPLNCSRWKARYSREFRSHDLCSLLGVYNAIRANILKLASRHAALHVAFRTS